MIPPVHHDNEEPPPKRKKPYRCADGKCGAGDCARCRPIMSGGTINGVPVAPIHGNKVTITDGRIVVDGKQIWPQ